MLISAGHSGTDPGAVGNGYQEATLAVKMRDRILNTLSVLGVKTLSDGQPGENQDLKKAIALCRKADLAIEIHFNAGAPAAHGVEALSKPNKKVMAQQLCIAINKISGIKLRGDQGWKADNSGQHHRLGFCEAGGIILEVCFISNFGDISAYVGNKLQIADAIAHAIFNYVKSVA